MKAIRRKLKSRQGASILLALLFFLICTLVSVSLLMAAVSNAGKIRSNREEHQKYLAVSSALELACDDFLAMEYTISYSCEEQALESGESKFIYKGFFAAPGSASAFWKLVQDDLGAVTKKRIEEECDRFQGEGMQVDFDASGLSASLGGAEQIVKVQLSSINAADYPELDETVTLKILIQEGYQIQVTAELDNYHMQALLSPKNDTVRLKKPGEVSVGDVNETEALCWERDYIVKQIEEAGTP